MSKLGALSGYTGLTKNINTAENAERNLSTLQNLKNNIDRDNQQNLIMQEMEAQQYEEIQKTASELLERDRDAINQKGLQLQSTIKDSISSFGSRKKFMQNGGLAMLKKYKNDILYSAETMRYKDNKKNLEQILSIQHAGKGHLISPKDLMKLQAYQSGQGNEISYSGLMSEIDYPAELFAYGENIPDINILHYKDNFLRIYGNYVTENGPDSLAGLSDSDVQEQLLNFMNKMNYTGYGTDRFLEQQRASERLAAIRKGRENVVKSGTNKSEVSFLSQLNNTLKNVVYDKNVTSKQLLESNYLTNLGDEGIKNYLGGQSAAWEQSYKQTATKSQSLLNGFGNVFGSDYFRPASAMKLPIQDIKKLAELAGTANEDGTINYNLSTDLYNANGSKFTTDDVDTYYVSAGGMDTQGKAKVLGAFVGFKTADNKILMNVVDKKGKIKEEENERHKLAYKDSSAKHSVFIAMQSEDDNQVFYKELDVTSIPGQNEIGNLLGSNNNIEKTIENNSKSLYYSEAAKKDILKNKKQISDNFKRASTNQGAFGNQNFVNEAQSFKLPDSGQNRNNLMKSYYMALDSFYNEMAPFDAERLNNSTLASRKIFSQRLTLPKYGDELKTDLLNYGVGDMEFIKKYIELYNDDEDMSNEDIERNNDFARLWNDYYKLIINN